MTPEASENLLHNVVSNKLEKTLSKEAFANEGTTECDAGEIKYGAGDALFASVVVAPLVVSVWRGTWELMDLHGKYFPFAQIYLLGIIIHTSFALVRGLLLSRSAGAWRESGAAGRWLRERLISRVYTYVFILACIMHWRGGWGLLDATVVALLPDVEDPHRPVLMAAFTILFYLCLTALRSARNLLAPPFFLFTDGKEATYLFTTRFNKASSKQTALYVLDCVFSVAVVGSLVVFVWRGSWALLDLFLFPEDPVKSCWTSLIVGYSVVIATFSLQAPIRWVTARLHGAPRLLLVDIYHFVSFLATVNVWRGFWGMLDIYFFPETPKLSNWCCHIISITLLMLLNCSNSILVRGVYIDAEEPAGECVVFPCHYLRLFFHKERTKKRHKRALAAAANRKAEIESSVPLQIPEEKV